MTHAISARFVATRIRVAKAIESHEAGQGALEYLGMVIVAAVLIIAVVTAFTGGGFAAALKDKLTGLATSLGGFAG